MSKKFVKFKIEDIFDVHSSKKKFNACDITFGGLYPYVARSSTNNGIRGYITEDTKYLNPAKSLSFGQDTATIFYQERAYFTGDKIKIMELKGQELTPNIAAYLITVLNSAFARFSWGQTSFDEKVLKTTEIYLPVVDGTEDEIDWNYMQERIKELEQERIKELDAYLVASGLEDYELTEEDKQNLSLSEKSAFDEGRASQNCSKNGQVKFKEFRMGDIFEQLRVKKAKKKNVKKYCSEEFCVPVVYAKAGDNGIMYWGRKNEFTTYANVISIVYNGAIAAGCSAANKLNEEEFL